MIGTTMLNGNKKTRNLLGLLVIWVGLVLGPTQITGFGQTSGPATNIRVFASDPTGNACSQTSVGLYGGALYTCQAGVYASAGGGGSFSTPVIITSTSNPCFAVGPNGATNPTLAVKCDVASAATGILVTPAAAGSGVTLGVTSSGSNENLLLTPKGTGQIITPLGAAATPIFANSTTPSSGLFWVTSTNLGISISGTERHRFGSGGAYSNTGGFSIGSTVGGVDIGFDRLSAGIARISNASTGAGQLLIGTSTDTADAQLSVYSQSTTRPGLKLRALSGTAAGQAALESYNAVGTLSASITAGGSILAGPGSAAAPAISFLSDSNTGFIPAVDNGGASGAAWFVSDGVIYSSIQLSGMKLVSSGAFQWSTSTVDGASDVFLYRDAANTLAQRNSTSAQSYRLYNTDNGANDEYLEAGSKILSNAYGITPVAAGSGTVRELVLGAAGSVTRLRTSLATPSAPALADGDWWVECSGTTPTRTCSVLVRDTGATRTIAVSVAF